MSTESKAFRQSSSARNVPVSLYVPNWKISYRSFVMGTLSYVLRTTSDILVLFRIVDESYFEDFTSAFVTQFLVFGFIFMCIPWSRFGIAWRALLLGCVLNLGLTLSTYSIGYQTLGVYCIFMAIFHWSEYMMQVIFNPDTTDVDSYMLYHSDAYVIAFFAGLTEFAAEFYVWPEMKLPNIITNLGITFVVFGECLRKSSMWTAKSNFNHYVQFDKREDHKLVTHGVYALFRHPSYVGWFWWSIGTQVILLNPLCIMAYAVASWKFFSQRIITEEKQLIKFFGSEYIKYQEKVGTGLPFIKGYRAPTVSKPVEPESHEKSE